jgi:hypothetical protein
MVAPLHNGSEVYTGWGPVCTTASQSTPC